MAAMTGPAATPRRDLRERKRRRTHETIVRVAAELFTEQGYHATTLIQIADAAEISPSTLHSYFPTKQDIVFSDYLAIRESLRRHIIDRSGGETLRDALLRWISEDLQDRLATTSAPVLLQRRAIVENDEFLLAADRYRYSLLEDVFVEAFASELGETTTDLRSRLLAAVATTGLRTIFQWWYPQLAEQAYDAAELPKLEGTYLIGLLDAAQAALDALPPVRGRQRSAGLSSQSSPPRAVLDGAATPESGRRPRSRP